jgi:hypothetical protein
MTMRPKRWRARLPALNVSDVHELMGSHSHPVKEMPSDIGMPGLRLSHGLLFVCYCLRRFKKQR